MPKQIREMFAYICCFCNPLEPLKLWQDHNNDFILDYLRTDNEDTAKNKALHNIESVLKQHGLSCTMIGLPAPKGNASETPIFNQEEEARKGAELIAKLNDKQFDAFRKIVLAVDNDNVTSRCFYIDGPGG